VTDQTTIFDRQLLRQRQTRAAAGFGEFDFLWRLAETDLAERLAEVRYEFGRALVFGGVGGMVRRVKNPGLLIEAGLISPLQMERVIEDGPASRSFSVGRGEGIFVAVDEEFLPFRRGAFDLIVSALSLHWVNDLPGALLQLRHALAPDGLFLGTMLGGETLHELRQVLLQAESELTGGVVPRVSPAADLRDMAGLLQRAGFSLPVADNDRITVTYPDIFTLFRDLRGMGATSVLHAGKGHPLTHSIILRAAELYQQRFSEDGRLLATFEFINLAGWTAPAK
jgi:NADH dehydrogenase [ubiquinone] 1 alpha subcomplex assembly factor 5